MTDQFVHEFIGSRVSLDLVGEPGTLRANLVAVGDAWIKVLVDKGQTVLIPIVNIKSMRVDDDGE